MGETGASSSDKWPSPPPLPPPPQLFRQASGAWCSQEGENLALPYLRRRTMRRSLARGGSADFLPLGSIVCRLACLLAASGILLHLPPQGRGHRNWTPQEWHSWRGAQRSAPVQAEKICKRQATNPVPWIIRSSLYSIFSTTIITLFHLRWRVTRFDVYNNLRCLNYTF